MIDYPMHCAPRCGAHARTTGQPCKSPAMMNGRCRMHGGKSTGRPALHGRFSKGAMKRKREWKRLLGDLTRAIDRLRQRGGG